MTRISHFHKRWNVFFSRPVPNFILRWAVMFVGSFILSFSIALARTAGLGTSCIASTPNVMSYVFPQLTIGQFQFIINVLLIVGQIILNRSWRRPVEWLQLFMAFFMSIFVDASVILLQGLPLPNYAAQWAWTALAIALLALGVYLELCANTVVMPGEGIVMALTARLDKPFGNVKIAFDVSNVVLAAIISLACFGYLHGVREGTVATALLTGVFVNFYRKTLAFIPRWIPETEKQKAAKAKAVSHDDQLAEEAKSKAGEKAEAKTRKAAEKDRTGKTARD